MLPYETDTFQKCLIPWGILNPSNTWFLGPLESSPPNCNAFGSAILAGFTNTNRLTDRPTTVVCKVGMVPYYLTFDLLSAFNALDDPAITASKMLLLLTGHGLGV